MLFSRNIISTVRSPVINAVIKRNIVSTPPRYRMSLPVKVLNGVAIGAVMLAYPLYISYNLKYYKGESKE